MAARTTVLTGFSENGNSRTSTFPGHTASVPKLVIEKRKVPADNQIMAEYSFKVVNATSDGITPVIPQKVSLESVVRYPITGDSADTAEALAVFRDMVASDEFANAVSTLTWQKP